MNILHIDAAVTPNSVTRQLTAAVADAILARVPTATVVHRDLAADPIAHLDAEALGTLRDNPELAAFLAADVVVVGAPMYNFAPPSQLKAWIDRIAVAGATFRYTAEGPQGLAGGKTVVLASARGGFYGPGQPAEALDFQERYLRAVFAFLGVADVAVVRAEGVAISPESRAAAIAQALAAVPGLAAPLAAPLAA